MTDVTSKFNMISADLIWYNYGGEGVHFHEKMQLIHVGGNIAIGYEKGNGIKMYEMAGNEGAWEIGTKDRVIHDIYDDDWMGDIPVDKLLNMTLLEFLVEIAARKTRSGGRIS
ncbi:hypothetical protein [Bacillus sp. JK127]